MEHNATSGKIGGEGYLEWGSGGAKVTIT